MTEAMFNEVLPLFRNGATNVELTEVLREAVLAVRDTGKPAKITLALTVTPNGVERVFVDADVSSKLPKLAREKTLFYVTEDGDLTEDKPRQQRLLFGGEETR